ncbi:hypothetical protein Tco_0914586, partial [Tanacetum coccineum]
LEPQNDKESPEVERTNDEEVEVTNVVIHVNVNEEEDEITGEVYELKRREKGKVVEEYFFGRAPSYTSIRDLILKLCHNLIACSIAGRSQALEKVTVTDLFFLRGMDVGSVNVIVYWLGT